MDKNVFSIENIFSGRLFRIPDYQRGYAWEVANCGGPSGWYGLIRK